MTTVGVKGLLYKCVQESIQEVQLMLIRRNAELSRKNGGVPDDIFRQDLTKPHGKRD